MEELDDRLTEVYIEISKIKSDMDAIYEMKLAVILQGITNLQQDMLDNSQ